MSPTAWYSILKGCLTFTLPVSRMPVVFVCTPVTCHILRLVHCSYTTCTTYKAVIWTIWNICNRNAPANVDPQRTCTSQCGSMEDMHQSMWTHGGHEPANVDPQRTCTSQCEPMEDMHQPMLSHKGHAPVNVNPWRTCTSQCWPTKDMHQSMWTHKGHAPVNVDPRRIGVKQNCSKVLRCFFTTYP